MPERTKHIIRELCRGRFGTACQDSELWKRVNPFAGLVRLDTVGYPVVITAGSMVDSGELQLWFPNEPNHPDQAYTTKEQP